MTTRETLVARAAASRSAAVVIVKDGRPVLDWTDETGHRPVETMSVTKLAVAIAVATSMCGDGPAVLDAPVTTWLTEWGDDRERITLRLLLGHRSGLRSIPASEVPSIANPVEAALDLPIEHEIGGPFIYNNLAFNLVGEIVRRETTKSVADVIGGLMSGDWDWKNDAMGRPWCHFGLASCADDLARLGALLLDGRGIVPGWWLEEAIATRMSCYGQAAWQRASFSPKLIDAWIRGGVDQSLILELGDLVDREMEFDDLWSACEERLGDDVHVLMNQVITRGLPRFSGSSGEVVGYGHDGDGGQYLVVMPQRGAVAVRQREVLVAGGLWSSFPGDAWAVAA